ncbi:hypothetical protein HPB50_012437 [Hyalomma asiaticum]|uniref:Uncharacterized protein n=1 Tax=Hyalomma asiaticum TaxID=266040 RepID=A0ACB7SY73_HYAAI|nr:hypothetical protein HPB50_012437 [Hyalomma asiaticum]
MARRIKHADPSFSGDHERRDSASEAQTPRTEPAPAIPNTRANRHETLQQREIPRSANRRSGPLDLFSVPEPKVVADTRCRDEQRDHKNKTAVAAAQTHHASLGGRVETNNWNDPEHQCVHQQQPFSRVHARHGLCSERGSS